MPPKKLPNMTTAQVRDAVKRKFCQPEWTALFEVRNGAGHHANRSADCIAMNTYPSRGLNLVGIEIKVSRSDFLSELKKPEKAEAFYKYCDRWWLITGPNVVNDTSEIPENWGWMIAQKSGLRIRKEAPRNKDVTPMPRTFLAAMMRRAGQLDDANLETKIRERTEALTKTHNAEMERAVTRAASGKSTQASEAIRAVNKFYKILGIPLPRWNVSFATDEVIRAVKAVMELERFGPVADQLKYQADLITQLANNCQDAVKKLRNEGKI